MLPPRQEVSAIFRRADALPNAPCFIQLHVYRARLYKYHDLRSPPSPTPSQVGEETPQFGAQPAPSSSAEAGSEHTAGGKPSEHDSHKQLDLCSTVAFHANYIMGSGFLALPFAFTELGVGVGTAVLVAVTLIAFATAMYTLEVMAGAEAIVRRAYTLAGRLDAAEQGGEPTPTRAPADAPADAPAEPGAADRSRLASAATRESCDSLNTVPLSDSDSAGILGPPAVARAPLDRSLAYFPHGRQRSNSASYGAVATHSLLMPTASRSPSAGSDHPSKGLPPDKATVRRSCPMCRPAVAVVRACCGLRCAAKAASACSEESHTVTVPLAAAEDPVAHPYLRITQRKFELVELVGMFMGGAPARRVYTLLVSAYLTGATWGYGTVFGHACAEHLALPFLHTKTANYQAYVLVFAVVVLAMACFDLREQKLVQQLMTGFRVLVMGVMVGTILVGALNGGTGPWPEEDFRSAEGGGLVPHAPPCATAGANGTSVCPHHGYMSFDATQIREGVAGVTLQAVARSAPIILYSVLLHPAVPVLAQPVKSKTRLFTAYGWTYTITTTAYTLLASSGSLFFGSAMSQSANLNWAQFGKGTGLEAFAYLVVLFPALDVLTITSVTVIALASNFMASWYGPAVAKVENSSWMTVVAFRMAGGVPPMIGALLVSDFATVLDFTGVVWFLVAFVVPPWLWLNMTYSVNCIWSADGGNSEGIRPGWHVHLEAAGDAQVSDKPNPDGSLEVSDAFASCQHAWFAVSHWQCSRRRQGRSPAQEGDALLDTPLARARVTRGSPAAQSPYVGPWSTPWIAWPILWFGMAAVVFVMLVLTGAVGA